MADIRKNVIIMFPNNSVSLMVGQIVLSDLGRTQ